MGYIPVFVVGNLHTLNGKHVLVLEVIALVHFVIVFTLWSSYGVLTDCLENDVDQLNIVRTHQEGRLIPI